MKLQICHQREASILTLKSQLSYLIFPIIIKDYRLLNSKKLSIVWWDKQRVQWRQITNYGLNVLKEKKLDLFLQLLLIKLLWNQFAKRKNSINLSNFVELPLLFGLLTVSFQPILHNIRNLSLAPAGI